MRFKRGVTFEILKVERTVLGRIPQLLSSQYKVASIWSGSKIVINLQNSYNIDMYKYQVNIYVFLKKIQCCQVLTGEKYLRNNWASVSWHVKTSLIIALTLFFQGACIDKFDAFATNMYRADLSRSRLV